MKAFLKNLKSILYLFKPYWKYNRKEMLLFIIVGSFIPAVATAGSVVYQQMVINALTDGKGLSYIIAMVVWLSSVIFLPQFVMELYDILISMLVLEETEAKIKRNIYQKAQETDFIYFDDPEFYDNYTWTIEERAQKAASARQLVLRFFSLSVTIVSVVGIIVAQDWVIVVITVAGLFLSMKIGFRQNQYIFARREETLTANRKLSYINRIFYMRQWAEDLKTTHLGQKLFTEYQNAYGSIFETIKKYRWLFALCCLFRWLLSFGVQVLVTVYLSYRIIQGKILIGSFVGLLTASAALKGNLGQFFDFIKNSNQLSFYAERLRQFEQLESTIERTPDDKKVVPVDLSKPFEVELRDVGFSYLHSNFKLEHINIHIRSGEKIAIVGDNGGGKSTLTKLLLRLYDTQQGEIMINGINIREYDVHELRDAVGIAPQSTNVYSLSLRENLMLYTDLIEEEKAREVCRKFGLESVLVKNQATLDSQMTREFDESGVLLSGGELQKLALARLFCSKFGLLILDEPSSALDPIAEYELNQLIFDEASSATTIIISHRLSSVRDADRIYLLGNGHVQEEGSHEELMERRGKYYEMFTKQSEYYVK